MSFHESVAIFWDYENCAPQSNTPCYETVHKIWDIALTYGKVNSFKAYLHLSDLSSNKGAVLRSELQACGVSLTDCPHNGRKDVADKMMIVDILQFGWDTPAPATVILISGDRDFAYTVSVLRMRHYRVVVVAPPLVHGSLKYQASKFYDWDVVVLGKHQRDVSGAQSVDLTSPGPHQNSPVTFAPAHTRQPSNQHPSNLARRSSFLNGASSVNISGHNSQSTTPYNPHRHSRDSPMTASPAPSQVERDVMSSKIGFDKPQGITDTESSSMAPPYHLKDSRCREGSSCSTSTFVTAATPTDTAAFGLSTKAPFELSMRDGCPAYVEVSFMPPPVGQTDARRASDAGHSRDTSPGRKVPQRASTSLPIPDGPRPPTIGSPLTRPATAGPVMMSAKNGTSNGHFYGSAESEHTLSTIPPLSGPPMGVVSQTTASTNTSSSTSDSRQHQIPPSLRPLIEVLDRLRDGGVAQPLRSHVAIAVLKVQPKVYENAGVPRFKNYAELAKQQGFVSLGGSEGTAWISLLPHWHGVGLVSRSA